MDSESAELQVQNLVIVSIFNHSAKVVIKQFELKYVSSRCVVRCK